MITNFFFFATSKGIALTLPLYIEDVLDFTITEVKPFAKCYPVREQDWNRFQ